MRLKKFYEMSTALYLSGKSVMLRSGPGRGKTTTIEACAGKIAGDLGKDIGIVTVSGPNLQPGDTVGFGVPKHNDDGTSDMVFTRPFFWRTEDGRLLEEYDGGIIFIDEEDKMDVDLKKVVGEMALSGRCGPHRLPPGWVVWMAGNRASDRSGSTKSLDHLINRRFEFEVTDDLHGWEEWATRAGVHHSIIAFAMQNPHIVFPDGPPDRQGPFCTPRSLVAAGEVLVTLGGNTGKLPDDETAVEVTAGAIGNAASAQLFATIRLENETPEMSEIVKNPETAKLPGAPDAQMLVAYKLAALTEESTLEPVIQYIQRLPADFSVTFAKSLCTRNPSFIAKPAMLKWCKENSAIMATMAVLK